MKKLNTYLQIQKELDRAWQEYQQKVLDIANLVQEEKLNPICIKHNLSFISQIDGWSVHSSLLGQNWNCCDATYDRFPNIFAGNYKLESIMNISINGYKERTLASFMKTFDPPSKKA